MATAAALAADYGGRVFVVNNQRISVSQRQSVMDALALAKAGKTAGEIKEILEEVKFESSIYIMVDTLKYLKKGGRLRRRRPLSQRFCVSSLFCKSRATSWMPLQRPEAKRTPGPS